MNNLTKKMISMFVIVVVLLVGIGMISSLINERMYLKSSVEEDIAKSSVRSQTLAGPVITVPYSVTTYDSDRKVYVRSDDALYFFPDQLNIAGDLTTEERYRGIYKANLYTFKGQLTGQFTLPKNLGLKDSTNNYEIGEPYIAMRVSDIRGIGNTTEMKLNGSKMTLSPLSARGYLSEGVKSSLTNVDLQNGGVIKFDINLELMGTSRLNFLSAGKETTVKLNGIWPHPSFIGNALPKERTVGDQSFQAIWEVNQFSNITPAALMSCWQTSESYCETNNITNFGVDLVDPVDHYRKSDRAVKYAILFIGLTFAGFFVFEVMRGMNIHAMQYALVGFALVLFFLLLISLSEHIGFLLAYWIASISCIGLITYYMHSVLRDKKLSLSFAGLLALLYITLYILLNGEEYSLLLGSILLFLAISATMILTRNVDWYALSQTSSVIKRRKVEEVDHEN